MSLLGAGVNDACLGRERGYASPLLKENRVSPLKAKTKYLLKVVCHLANKKAFPKKDVHVARDFSRYVFPDEFRVTPTDVASSWQLYKKIVVVDDEAKEWISLYQNMRDDVPFSGFSAKMERVFASVKIAKYNMSKVTKKLTALGKSTDSGLLIGRPRTLMLQQRLLDAKVPPTKHNVFTTDGVDVVYDDGDDDDDVGEKFDEVAEVIGKSASGWYAVVHENGVEDAVSRNCIPDDVFQAYMAAVRDDKSGKECAKSKRRVVEVDVGVAQAKTSRLRKKKGYGDDFVVETNGDDADNDEDVFNDDCCNDEGSGDDYDE